MTIPRLHGLAARPATALCVACIGAAGLLGIFAEPASAQQPSPPATPPQQAESGVATAASAAEKFLGLSEIERRVSAAGVRVTEIEVKDKVVEVEGRDASNREVEMIVDRRSGEILSRRNDD